MKIDDFLARLEGVQPKGGGGWVAKCPGHPDDNPSLGIDVGADGRILIKCYAGCSAKDVVDAMGLKMSDLMPDDAKPVKRGRAKKAAPPAITADAIVKPLSEYKRDAKRDYGKLVEAYDYHNADGAAIFRVERRVKKDGRKTFVQMHPDPSSRYGWSWGVSRAGVERVPFRLPRVLAAAKAGKSIIIVEGEKDVLAVERALKGVATCNPGGAGKWQAGWGKYFVGARMVLIVADKDPIEKKDPKTGEMKPFAVGQRHACDVEAKLRADGFEGEIRKVVMPDVGERHVKDFADWVEAMEASGASADVAAMTAVVRNAGEWPAEWEFGAEADADALTRAGKAARGSLSDTTEREGAEAPGKRGRFGARIPRAPDEARDGWTVDFALGGGKFVTLEIDGKWDVAEIYGRCYYNISRECPNNTVPKDVPVRLRAWSVAIWLLMRGSFFWDNAKERDFEKAMFLDRDPETCRLMRVMSNEFFAFVGAAARLEDIDPKKGDLAKILGLVKQISVDPDYSRGVTPGSSWTREGDRIYISSGDTRMCRVTPTSVEMVQNGTDGVVFLRGETLQPWDLQSDDGLDPFVSAPIFRDASWVETSAPVNVKMWMLNLFACHKTKPILLVTGKAQSGKTRLARAIKEILGMRKDGVPDSIPQTVEDGDKGCDAFWVAINSSRLEIFDNLDTRIKWVSDAFQNAATGGATKRRALYKDSSLVVLNANAAIIITSNNPLFSTDGDGGMADRIIATNLIPRQFTDERGVEEDIVGNRPKYLTWIARTLSKALADTAPVDKSVNKRHPDYGMFSMRLGRALGCEKEVLAAMSSAEVEKALLPLRNDIVMAGMLQVLEKQDPPWQMRFTSGEMSAAILAAQGDEPDDRMRQMYSSRKVGKAMGRFARQLDEVFLRKAPRLLEGRTVYEITGLTAAGRFALVKDLPERRDGGNGVFGDGVGESSIHERGRADFPALNPPNPPYAQARGHTPSIETERKEEGDREDEELSDSWEFDL